MKRRAGVAIAALVVIAGGLSGGVLAPLERANASARYSPPARSGAGTVYDVARGDVVLFGGLGRKGGLNDTWTWDGTLWTKQHPATSPPARRYPGMAYDAARHVVVMYGGSHLSDTWTWDGTDWTQQHPANSPSDRYTVGMAYDAARAEVVLFSGGGVADTWTWDGTNWTQRHPQTSPVDRGDFGIAYDAARKVVVLFGGANSDYLNDTWTWDGTNWTQQHPKTSPPDHCCGGMAYDAARSEVVLFGGCCNNGYLNDTWTWDGTTWTQRHSTVSPPIRVETCMTYDAARAEVVLFGGYGYNTPEPYLGDTWTWDGTRWRIPFVAHLKLDPASGSPGTTVRAVGTGFAAFEDVTITFVDSVNGKTVLGTFTTHGTGNVKVQATIPLNSTPGAQKITAVGAISGQKAKAIFTIS